MKSSARLSDNGVVSDTVDFSGPVNSLLSGYQELLTQLVAGTKRKY